MDIGVRPHYETLGIAENATQEEIKKAYRRKARISHTDREGGSHEEMTRINVAYEVLSDLERRKNYDETGEDKINALYHEAEQLMLGKMLHWLQSMSADTNVVSVVLTELAKDLVAIEEKKTHGERVVAKLNYVLNKIRYNGKGNDKFRILIESQRDGIEEQMKDNEKDIRRINLACQIARNYSYESGETIVVMHRPMLFHGTFMRFP